MKQKIFVRNELIGDNRHNAKEKMILYFFHLTIQKHCRKCIKILDKHQKNDEQDLDKIINPKQYCKRCQMLIKTIDSQLSQRVSK